MVFLYNFNIDSFLDNLALDHNSKRLLIRINPINI